MTVEQSCPHFGILSKSLLLRFKTLPRYFMSFELSFLGFLVNLNMFSMFVTCLHLLVICIFSRTSLGNFQKILMESSQNSWVGGRIRGWEEEFSREWENSREGKVEDESRVGRGSAGPIPYPFPDLDVLFSLCHFFFQGQLHSLGPGRMIYFMRASPPSSVGPPTWHFPPSQVEQLLKMEWSERW